MTQPIPKRGSPLPEADHVLRYIPPRHIEDGVVNGMCFRPKVGEDAPSVNWLEWFKPPIEAQVAGVRSVARLVYAKNGRLARLNVGQTIQYVRENDVNRPVLAFVHDPLDPEGTHTADPSHAVIHGVPTQDTPEAALLMDLIGDCILLPLFLAVQPAGPGAS